MGTGGYPCPGPGDPVFRNEINMAFDLEDIAVKVQQIGKRNPVYAELSQWVGDLLSTTVRAAGKLQSSGINLEPANLPETWYQGKSFLNPEELTLDWEQTRDLFQQLVNQVKTKDKGREQAVGLLAALDENLDGTLTLMKSVLKSDFEAIETAAQKLNVDPSLLTLLLRLALRPALVKTAQTVVHELDLNRWGYGHCPVCGSVPKLADLSGEGGKRTLHCSLCETAWPYPRLRCPFCENSNREDLSYLKAESEEGLRVDLCSRCGQHLKTIDLRELPGLIIVPLDDVATWHLDLIAQENLKDEAAGKNSTI